MPSGAFHSAPHWPGASMLIALPPSPSAGVLGWSFRSHGGGGRRRWSGPSGFACGSSFQECSLCPHTPGANPAARFEALFNCHVLCHSFIHSFCGCRLAAVRFLSALQLLPPPPGEDGCSPPPSLPGTSYSTPSGYPEHDCPCHLSACPRGPTGGPWGRDKGWHLP